MTKLIKAQEKPRFGVRRSGLVYLTVDRGDETTFAKGKPCIPKQGAGVGYWEAKAEAERLNWRLRIIASIEKETK